MAKDPVVIVGSNVVDGEVATPSDATDLSKVTSGAYPYASFLYVGVSGDVTVRRVDGTNFDLPGLGAGSWHPVPPFTRVMATGTTATGIRAGY